MIDGGGVGILQLRNRVHKHMDLTLALKVPSLCAKKFSL